VKEIAKKIPLGILFIIILTVASGLILLTMSIFSFIVLFPLGPTVLMGPGFLFVLGLTSLLVSVGLYKRKAWSWRLLLILSGFGAAGYLLNLVSGNLISVIGIVINAVIIYYMFKPKVRKYLTN
jgi:hypothetical protein